jgi:hypothetical protein
VLEELAVASDVTEDVGQQDEKEVADLQSHVKRNISRVEEFGKDLRDFKKELRIPKPQGAVKRKGGVREKPLEGPRLPVKPPVFMDDSTEAVVAAYLPPDFRLWRDDFCNRWQLRHKRSKYLSMSWAKHGYVASAHSLLEKAWQLHVMLGGAAAPWPLLPPAAAASVDGAGVSAGSGC